MLGKLRASVQLLIESGLLSGSRILVQNTLSSSLIDRLHCDLVSALGLGAIAFNGSSLELLDSSLQCGLIGFVASISRLCHQNTLLSRLDIRQTKHLPDDQFRASEITSTQDDILTSLSENCKHFLNFCHSFLHIPYFLRETTRNLPHFVAQWEGETQV